jgi:hypothetical protein
MPTDVLIDSTTYDLVIEDGDFAAGNPTSQNQLLLLLTNPGNILHSPGTGVGLQGWVNAETTGGLKAEIKRQFTADGMEVQSIKLEGSKITINAKY